MKKVLRVLSSQGDQMVEFDEANAAATEIASALFERVRAEGAAVLNVTPEGKAPAQRVAKFEDLGEEAVVVPRIVGG